MVDVETLMRYIRVFSELSNQLRYGTQKRVLVEIALIKLCRPAMETNLDSVLDRIRVLEKQMEERPAVQQVIMTQPSEENQAQSVEKQEPAKAAPEDLKKIMSGWSSMIAETTGLFKQMLRKSVPKYNGETGESILYVEFQDFLAQPYVDEPQYAQELQQIIEGRTGKRVEIQMLMAGGHQNHALAELTVDQAMRENINMDVVIEEDPDTLLDD